MIDINLIRENPELVKENIKKKFQDEKLVLVDEVKSLDEEYRALRKTQDDLRNKRNTLSKQIGMLMGQGKKQEAEEVKAEVKQIGDTITANEQKEQDLENQIKERMLVIPNIIDKSVPIGEDDSKNVELQQFGTKRTFNYEIPYHTDIMEALNGIDIDSARKTQITKRNGDRLNNTAACKCCITDLNCIIPKNKNFIKIFVIYIFNNGFKSFHISMDI